MSLNQQVREIGERYEFRATVVKSEQLRWWLRGFGPALELVSPADLLYAHPGAAQATPQASQGSSLTGDGKAVAAEVHAKMRQARNRPAK